MKVQTWDVLPCQILYKKIVQGDSPLENLYPKLLIFTILGALSSHFYAYDCEMWHDKTDPGFASRVKFRKDRSRDSPAGIALPFR